MTEKQPPSFGVSTSTDATTFSLTGTWTTLLLDKVEEKFLHAIQDAGHNVVLDISKIDVVDTNGAWLLEQFTRQAISRGAQVSIVGADEKDRSLLDAVHERPQDIEVPTQPPALLKLCNDTGKAFCKELNVTVDIIGFFGEVIVALLRSLAKPKRFRKTALFYHLEHVGLRGIPIVALLSFLIGMVIGYMGVQQLRQFGAEVFVIQLVRISMLRELGILLTAIVIAGRSGSAFTAQIGAMISNEEIYAMRTMGLSPIDALVIPRVLALLIMLPILGFIADIMGLLGGALMVWQTLDIGLQGFIIRLHETFYMWDFYAGIIKAPFFAVVIATIGCFQGLHVTGSAESVGQLTTKSVIESIFAVIVIDAGFAIFFARIGV